MTGRPADPRPVDADLATLREAIPGSWEVRPMSGVNPFAALDRVEAELSRLREQRDALAEAQQFPVETVMSWKRQVDDAKRRSASALLLLDPERQDEPDEENAQRAFEILSGLRPPTFRPDRERAEAAEARCARLQQALREIAEIDERDDSRPIFFGLQNAFFKVQRIAREALAGPDTPADRFRGRGHCECERRDLSEHDECLYDDPCLAADSQEDKT